METNIFVRQVRLSAGVAPGERHGLLYSVAVDDRHLGPPHCCGRRGPRTRGFILPDDSLALPSYCLLFVPCVVSDPQGRFAAAGPKEGSVAASAAIARRGRRRPNVPVIHYDIGL